MKSITTFLLGMLVLLATLAGVVLGRADPIDELLGPSPSVSDESSQLLQLIDERPAASAAEAPAILPTAGLPAEAIVDPTVDVYEDVAQWTEHQVEPPLTTTVVTAPHPSADHKAVSWGPTNLVPEPSTLLLAAAALGYFMLFGRRRLAV